MGFWKNLFSPQQRSIDGQSVFGDGWSPDSPWTDISGDNVLRVASVFGAVRLIADGVASLPWGLWQSAGTGSAPSRLPDPEWFETPDDRFSTFDWIHQGLVELLLHGNAYGIVWRRDDGSVREIDWVPRSDVTVQDIDSSSQRHWPRYWVNGVEITAIRSPLGAAQPAGTPLMLHVPAFAVTGTVRGINPIAQFRSQFEMSRNATDTANSFFGQRAPIPGGILKNDQTLNQEQADTAKQRFRDSVKPGDVATLDKHWSFEKVTLDAGDLQFLETIKASATQIAVIFGVDPRDIGGSEDSSLTYSTVEGNERKLVLRTLQPWAIRLQQALSPVANLDKPFGAPRRFVRFDLDARSKPDALTWAKVQSERLDNGTLTLGEARVDNGDPALSMQDVDDWQTWYRTTKSSSQAKSESTSQSVSESTSSTQEAS
ncbi:phage portal protein [Bifidobacterium subtile]|jgi:HK97 family phage portal protein|uniref:phage portal protein n=1 Tax=Bifidobacterium subtile TaxID=77635 RepID=UPI002F353CAA